MSYKESEVRNEIKEELEYFLRGKFQGGELTFMVFLESGVYFTNHDFFRKRNHFLNYLNQARFSKIELVVNEKEAQEMLLAQMNPSMSIIRVSKDASGQDYQSTMIERITENENTIQEVLHLLTVINALSVLDKDIIIVHGILGIPLTTLAEHWNKKTETIRRGYVKALENLAFTKGLLTFK